MRRVRWKEKEKKRLSLTAMREKIRKKNNKNIALKENGELVGILGV